MRARLEEALERALAWLGGFESPPELVARGDQGEEIPCVDLPFAAVAASWIWRRAAGRVPPPRRAGEWLAAACDPDGWVRFYGPGAPIIGPDLDDTALVWAERRALTGWEPPAPLLARVLESRGEGGALNTWPTPPEDSPAVEVDTVVNANVLALLGAMGLRDEAAERFVGEALAALAAGGSPPRPYYPDPALLWLFALRASSLGGLSPTWIDAVRREALETLTGRGLPTLAARVALAGEAAPAEEVAALLAGQRDDGSWPWAAVFVGGRHNVFPDGRALQRPRFGGAVLSTSLAFEALSRAAGWRSPGPAPSRGPVSAARRSHAPWEALVGPLTDAIALSRREVGGRAVPLLVGPDRELAIDLTPRATTPRFFRASERWAASYREGRPPAGEELVALERLLARLDALPEPAPQPSPEAAAPKEVAPPAGSFASTRPDAGDLPAWVAAQPPSDALRPVELAPDLALPDALPALGEAVTLARRRGVRLHLAGLPWCALPWNDDWLRPAAPGVPRRPFVDACDRCVEAHRCPGPAGGRVRPRTSATPWVPVDRVARAWQRHLGHPAPAVWAAWGDALHDLAAGAYAGSAWSVTLAIDVPEGRIDPTFRLAVFHRRVDGTFTGGGRFLDRLDRFTSVPGGRTDAAAMRRLLAPVAGRVPLYPGLTAGADGARTSAYVDTDRLAPRDAWAVLRALAEACGRPLETPADPPRVLGAALHADLAGPPSLDLYLYADGPAWAPPAAARAMRGPGECVATVRVDPRGALRTRKWDVPWWTTGRDAQALCAALALGGRDVPLMGTLLDEPGWTLHPTTLGWREGGRRIYARIV